MIKLITFDLWNTLISGGNIENQRMYRVENIHKYLKTNNIEIEREKIAIALIHAWKYFMTEWENKKYTPTTNSMVQVIFESLKIEKEDKIFNHVLHFMESSLLKMDNNVIEGIRELLDELKDNYYLAIISDTGFTPGKYLRILLKDLDIYKYFSFYAFSDEIGVAKPDKRIFEYVLNYFNTNAENALHVGDLIRTDVLGANNIGMKSIRFNKEQYIDEDMNIEENFLNTDDTKKILQFIKEN